MNYQEKTALLKNGKNCLLRTAEESDAEMLLEYLKVTSAQTPYTAREPEEVRTSVEEEVELIRKKRESAGFEQMELDVVSTNAPAIGLYKKLGFVPIGTMPRALKYRDGSYADFLLMVKQL
ncbi:MAG: hypothetical protein K2N78_02150 [Oscillospiraceae bacterium]|nr:hypothetical protein [Oscillospiraceae bacterium]